MLFSFYSPLHSQSVQKIQISTDRGLSVEGIALSDSLTLQFNQTRPLFSFILNGKLLNSGQFETIEINGVFDHISNEDLKISYSLPKQVKSTLTYEIIFENRGLDTLSLSNVVPFGEDNKSVFITGHGPPDLARASLFRPGYRPVRLVLPDNAWELGYISFPAGSGLSVCALARRMETEGGQKHRYETILPPGSKVSYLMYTGVFGGEWQNGLKLMFRDNYLYDLEEFDNILYERSDLAWIRESYLIILMMAWDREFYDRFAGKYNYGEFLKKSIDRFGKIDVFGIWPTWPRLGLDRRNQWDLYSDLPGGTGQLRNFVRMSRPYGTRFFIAYNPWDNSTRQEDHLKGMTRLISETEADGVVLDTKGSSSYALQAAADAAREGVVMYSEGMAITKDMPGIISGRVHNAIFLSPELNLNKLIKPDFGIFRVCDTGKDILHREIAVAFFNGYGTELNMFRPGGRDENFEADLDFLAHTTFTLRQNHDAFLDKNWTPFIETAVDNVFVNRWKSGGKSVYTVLNMRPEGVSGKLFRIEAENDRHYLSLWNHENLEPEVENGVSYLRAMADGWPSSWAGTRKEGSVDCIAAFPDILRSELTGDSLRLTSSGKGKTVIWKGKPSYKTINEEVSVVNDTVVSIRDLFGYYEGKIVVQLIDDDILVDENVHFLKGGKPWLISKMEPSKKMSFIPDEMVLIPGTLFSYEVSSDDDFIPYPPALRSRVKIDTFLIDRYPVTNAQYYSFIVNTGYIPSDTSGYLRHWESGIYRQGQDKYPVVNLSYEDMQAYAKWAGKRLPVEAEWQLASQGTDNRKWPWGNEFHGTYCNNAFDRSTPVDAFSKGQSPYGVMDMVGNVWQMTNDIYFNGTNYFVVIRGGSYYKPDSSWWYVKGGPQQLDRTQIMLMVSPGFDRNSTVGFRCVMDADAAGLKR